MTDWKAEQLKVATGVTDGSRNAEYERGFIDGMQEQMRRSVDRAVNAMAKREWVGLTDEEVDTLDCVQVMWQDYESCEIHGIKEFYRAIEAKLKEKNA